MVAQAIPNVRRLIDEGHACMQAGHLARAWFFFDRAVMSRQAQSQPLLKAETLQMRGLIERLLGALDASLKSLEAARSITVNYPSFVLGGRVLRDLAATYQALCWRYGNKKYTQYSSNTAYEYYRDALNSLEASVELFERLAQSPSHYSERHLLMAETEASRGFMGAVMCEYGRSVRDGALLICAAQRKLSGLPQPVFAFNNAIRAMLFGPLSWRLGYALEALELIRRDASNGSAKRIVAALFGNRVYRLLQKS